MAVRLFLEIIPRNEGRTVVSATELKEDAGTRITNVVEHLASFVCDRFGIELPGSCGSLAPVCNKFFERAILRDRFFILEWALDRESSGL